MKYFLRYRAVNIIFFVSLLLVSGGCLWAYFSLRGAAGPVIVHFNDLSGINQVGSAADFLKVGVTAAVIVLVNYFAAIELAARDGFLGKFLAAITLLFGILLFIGFAAIISVN